ncbi:DUF4365 domain-containing protein [Stenomitos frigidus]
MNQRPRRLTGKMQQEDISRCQFKEWLTRFGWQAIEPQRDLGEDMLIHVYFDGRATGTIFHIQLKSVTNLEQRRNKRSDSLSYPFEVKDLKHWAEFDQPVVLVIWDIILREGRWILVDDAVSCLNEKNSTWRNKKTVSVNIVWKNDTSNSGFAKLRRNIGNYFYPLISRDKELKLRLRTNFTNTSEGLKEKENFQKFIRKGEPLILDEEYIKGVDFSEWWSKWFLPDGARFYQIEIIPKGDKEVIANKIEFLGRNGKSVVFENVVFCAIRAGTELLLLSNEHQFYPVHFQIEYRKTEGGWTETFQPQFTLSGHNVTDTRKIVDFWEISASGGRIVVEFSNSEHGIKLDEFSEFLPQLNPLPPYFIEFVDKLYKIQNLTGCIINIPLDISDWAISFTNQLFEIISTGILYVDCPKIKINYTADRRKPLIEESDEGGFIEIVELIANSSAEIFGTEISLGKREDTIRGKLTLTKELVSKVSELKEGEAIEIDLFEVTIIRKFESWIQKQHCN